MFFVSSNDADKFREDLMNIARTTLSSKILVQHKDYFSNLAVDAILRLKVSQADTFVLFLGCLELLIINISIFQELIDVTDD